MAHEAYRQVREESNIELTLRQRASGSALAHPPPPARNWTDVGATRACEDAELGFAEPVLPARSELLAAPRRSIFEVPSKLTFEVPSELRGGRGASWEDLLPSSPECQPRRARTCTRVGTTAVRSRISRSRASRAPDST